MKNFFFVLVIITLSSCNSNDEQFCKCMQAGEELNNFSSTLFEGDVTETKAKNLQKLKAAKKKECANYQTMSGEEMMQKKTECK